MPRKTRKGRRAHQHILGFKEFVERVEKDRLERLGLRAVSHFEKLLPFAFVLGAADAWAEAFADLYTEPPDWYVGRDQGTFRPRRFVSRVGHSLDTVGSVNEVHAETRFGLERLRRRGRRQLVTPTRLHLRTRLHAAG